MAKTKAQKEFVAEKLKDIFSKTKSVVLVNFHGLTVKDADEVRTNLRSLGVGYYVAKKTLTKRALEGASFEGDLPSLEGELAIVYSDEETTAPRNVYAFEKKLDGRISILGGVFENKYLGREQMVEIAQIPDITTLRGMFVYVINSPIQGLAIALSKIAEKQGA